MSSRLCLRVITLFLFSLPVFGCALHDSFTTLPQMQLHSGVAGSIHGGQQPVTGATIKLWSVSTTGDGSAATSLLGTTVLSDSNGSFNITGDFTCPSASSLVYITATGGNPDLSASQQNPNLAMLTALGACSTLNSSTFVTINEVTTAAAVMALAPYITSYSAIGSGTGDASALSNAFATAAQFADTTHGVAPGPTMPSGYGVDAALLYTLADILSTCINSTGTSGSSPGCSNLFNLTGNSGDTVQALLYIANHPTANTSGLFALLPAAPPFTPAYTTAPSSFSLSVQPKVATPAISPTGGTYTTAQTVTLTDSTSSSIYYTLDGSTPTTSSSLYSNPITVHTTETINAIAVRSGYLNSDEASTTFFWRGATPLTGTIATVAGTGTRGYNGDGIQATAAQVSIPNTVTFDSYGDIVIADSGNLRVRLINSSGIISTIAGNGTSGVNSGTPIGDNGAATSALVGPVGVGYDNSGNLFIADQGHGRVRKVTPQGVITTVEGNGANTAANGLAVDSSNNVYYTDGYGNIVGRINAQGGITTVAGGGSQNPGDGGPATSAGLYIGYGGVATDSSGNVYFAEDGNNRVRKVDKSGNISTIAGTGSPGNTGDGGLATAAKLSGPISVAVDASGNIYIADTQNCRVRVVNTQGIISNFAGSPSNCSDGPDGGAANATPLAYPTGVAVDASGNVYVTDEGRVRIVYH